MSQNGERNLVCLLQPDRDGVLEYCPLSDSCDHKAEAVHAALWSTLEYTAARELLVDEDRARELSIEEDWMFTKAGHGKSPCDGVGGKIKGNNVNFTVLS